jgi:hypothetical protein
MAKNSNKSGTKRVKKPKCIFHHECNHIFLLARLANMKRSVVDRIGWAIKKKKKLLPPLFQERLFVITVKCEIL